MDRLRARVTDENGYTLVELMTVVLIIAILLAMALASYVPATHAANAAACRNNQQVLEDAYTVAFAQAGVRPDDLNDLASFVANYDRTVRCPEDGAGFTLDPATGRVRCPNHP